MIKNNQKGFTLLELMIGMVIIAPIVGYGAKSMMASHDRQEAAMATSEHLSVVAASRSYLRDNIMSGTIPTGNVIDDLISDGYLETTLSNNNFGQEFIVEYNEGATSVDAVTTVVASVGSFVPERIVNMIARGMGQNGFYVSADDDLIAPLVDDVSILDFSFSDYSEVSKDESTVIFLDTYNRKAEVSDFLYRHKVDGFPELNQMRTDLDMDVNNITNVNRISFEDGNGGVEIGEECGTLDVTFNSTEGRFDTLDELGEKSMIAKVDGTHLMAECRYGRWGVLGQSIGSISSYLVDPSNLPPGVLQVVGQTVSASEYPGLVEVLTGGPGSPSAELPDMRGVFLRGYDPTGIYDPDGARTLLGSSNIQLDTFKAHDHDHVMDGAGRHNHNGNTTTNGSHKHNVSVGNTTVNVSTSLYTGRWGISDGATLQSSAGDGGLSRTGTGDGRYKYSDISSSSSPHNHSVSEGNGLHSHNTTTDYDEDHIHDLDILDRGEDETRPVNVAVVYGITAY